MRLNIGCGSTYAEGWVNVDIHPDVIAEFHTDAADLPIASDHAEMVYLGHMLACVPLARVPLVLAEAKRVLEPGGFLCVVGPDLHKIDAELQPDEWERAIYGGQDGRDDLFVWHKWPSTGHRLYSLVSDVFPDAVLFKVGDLANEWPISSHSPYQAAVMARKPY